MSDVEQRGKIVKVLKSYPGITANMDLSTNSALVVDLALAIQPAHPVDGGQSAEELTYGIDPASLNGDMVGLSIRHGKNIYAYTGEETEALLAWREARDQAFDEARLHLYTSSQIRQALHKALRNKTKNAMVKVIIEDVAHELQQLIPKEQE